MLNLCLWIGQSADGKIRVLYEHYMKSVSSRYLISYRSAHPESMKINVLVNEALRILRNCSSHLQDAVVKEHLQYFVKRMQFSGYPQEYRYEVMMRAFKIIQQERGRKRTAENGGNNKKKKKKQWYDQERYDGVMFVEVTPNAELKQKVQKACTKNKLKVKVVEKMSRSVKASLQRSNPFGWRSCERGDCPTCVRGIEVNCRARGVVYEIECVDCTTTERKMYRGQSGRSLYERMKEHVKNWEEGTDDSCLHTHAEKFHHGGQFQIDVRLLKECYGRPTSRMVSEAVLIQDLPAEQSMNSKAEWTYVRLPRVTVS